MSLDDLTSYERPILSEDIDFGGSLATDDSGFLRFRDPITGEGLWTSNSNAYISGFDPRTGELAPVGTDVGFGAPTRRYITSHVFNGAFEEPPADPDSPLGEDNPLPFWRVVHESGEAFEFRWTEVGNGNGQVIVKMNAGAAGDRSYLEALVPVNSSTGPRWFYELIPYLVSGGPSVTDPYVEAQYVDPELADTGTAGTSSTGVEVVYPNSDGQAPGDARYLRIRLGFERDGGAATSDTSTGSVISEAAVNGAAAVSTFRSWTPVITFATPGNLAVTYATQSGRYTKIGANVFWWVIATTSSFTHTTASGAFRVTGLPFAGAAVNQFGAGGSLAGYTKAGYTQITPYVASGQAYIEFVANGSGVALANLAAADIPTGGTVGVRMSGFYTI